jgi:hypothetical protein
MAQSIVWDDKQNTIYVPMYPEVVRNEPGSCPICGMDGVPRVVQKDDRQEEVEYRQMLKRFWIAKALTYQYDKGKTKISILNKN